MLNYKLTSKTIEDKENLEVILNTSPEIFMITRKNDLELYGFDSAKTFTSEDYRVIKQNVPVEMEENLLVNNCAKCFLTTKFLIKDKDTNIIRICGISLEITKQKETEQKIKELAEQLEIEKEYAKLNSITDGLTRINNRRYFDDLLRKYIFKNKISSH